jgi:hypothetical protein
MHPLTSAQLANDRRAQFQKEAATARLASEARARKQSAVDRLQTRVLDPNDIEEIAALVTRLS